MKKERKEIIEETKQPNLESITRGNRQLQVRMNIGSGHNQIKRDYAGVSYDISNQPQTCKLDTQSIQEIFQN